MHVTAIKSGLGLFQFRDSWITNMPEKVHITIKNISELKVLWDRQNFKEESLISHNFKSLKKPKNQNQLKNQLKNPKIRISTQQQRLNFKIN